MIKYTKTTGPKTGKMGKTSGVNLGPYASQPALNKQAPNPNNGGKAGHTGKAYNKTI
jgi:hypothetical protein